jgi:hypothetical protein
MIVGEKTLGGEVQPGIDSTPADGQRRGNHTP